MQVAILTDLREINDGHSLVHVVRDQVTMLHRYGHDVTVFVDEGFTGDDRVLGEPWLERCFPSHERAAYDRQEDIGASDKVVAERLSRILTDHLVEYPVVFIHDWIFSPRKLPMAQALDLCADATRNSKFYHWVHSVPSGHYDWWDLNRYGENHTLIYPSAIDLPLISNLFAADTSKALAIPHIVDLRTLFSFSHDAYDLLDKMPGLLSADFSQVYPVARDRLEDKGLRSLIFIFKALKKLGSSVCLLIADSWTGIREPEEIEDLKNLAYRNGFERHEFAFTSDLGFPKFVPQRTLMELQQCCSTFVFPSRGESFGLAAHEALLAGGCFPVFNKNVSAMVDVFGGNGLFLPFGSMERGNNVTNNERDYYQRAAGIVRSSALRNPAWMARNYIRQHYNMDAVYRDHYASILEA